MKIPLILVAGYLGSGKTTFLKRYLNNFADIKKIGIIQNEFSESDVDGKGLKMTGKKFNFLEINKGSVFCVCLLSDFKKSLAEFANTYSPDLIILEATGLADPINIAEILQSPELSQKVYLSSVWTIIDSSNFLKLEKIVVRMSRQVMVADVIIINKSDKTDNNTKLTIKKRIKELNPYAAVYVAEYCNIPINQLGENILSKPVALKISTKVKNIESCGRPEVFSFVIKTTKSFKLSDVKSLLDAESAKLFRIKGIVKLSPNKGIFIQCCYGDNSFENINEYSGNTEIILMGDEDNTRSFSKKFLKIAQQK